MSGYTSELTLSCRITEWNIAGAGMQNFGVRVVADFRNLKSSTPTPALETAHLARDLCYGSLEMQPARERHWRAIRAARDAAQAEHEIEETSRRGGNRHP